MKTIALRIAAAFLAAFACTAHAQNINTIAGGGPCGGAALGAPTGGPGGIVFDGAGNYYFTLYAKKVVCKVTIATGAISTIAGVGFIDTDGVSGGFADGLTAVLARLDPGNLGNSLAFDAAGDLYLADLSNNRVRKVSFSTGVITTVAGNGTAAFSGDGGPATQAALHFPASIAIQNGNLFIADQNNLRIRRVNLASGIIDTIAGNGTGGPSGDGGLALNAGIFPQHLVAAADGTIYIGTIEAGNTIGRVRKLTMGAGVTAYTINTVAGGGASTDANFVGSATAVRLGVLRGLAIDTDGSLILAHANTPNLDIIRKVSLLNGSGTISRYAGSTRCQANLGDGANAINASFCDPGSLAVDGAGNLHVADFTNNRVRRIDKATGIVTTVAGGFTGTAIGVDNLTYDAVPALAAPMYGPIAAVNDAAGNLFIAESMGHRIRKVDAATGKMSIIAGSSTGGYNGTGMLATATQLNNPNGIAVNAAGAVYIADTTNHLVRRIDPVTKIATIVAGTGAAGFSGDGGPATSAALNVPTGLAFDSLGNLYIADSGNNRVRILIASNGIIGTRAGGGASLGDNGPGSAALLSSPRAVAFDAAGNAYIADFGQHRVRKLTPGGLITTVAGSGLTGYTGDGGLATAAKMISPGGVAIDAAGNLHVSENNHIRTVAAGTGIITTTAGPGSSSFLGDGGPAVNAILAIPKQIAIGTDGHLLVSDSKSNRIRQVRLLAALAAGGDEDNDGIPNAIEAQEARNPFAKDNDVFANTRLFVMQQYRDFLGREGDAAGIQYSANLIDGGQAVRANVIESFFSSPEFQGVGSPIARLYFATFLRVPDYAGLIFQIGAFKSGVPLPVIANNFTLSGEFQQKYGALGNAQFVALLYTNILGRAAAQSEIDYYVGLLGAGVTRGETLVSFSESPEFRSAIANEVYVTMMYVGMLHRAPEPAGFDYWVSYMDAGNPGINLILGFLNAPEYHNRFLP